MKYNRWIRLMILVMIFTIGIVGLAACGQKQDEDGDDGGGSSNDEVTKITVGTGMAYKPYCYLDDDGNLAGYEYEVLKAIDELLPQYEFEYETSDFPSLFTSLEAGKLDMIAHQIEYNDERGQKYLFGEESYTTFITYITVLKSNNDISSLDDLAGKELLISTGSAAEPLLNAYNEEHPDAQINLNIQSGLTEDEIIASLESGKVDATIRTKRDVERLNENYGDVIKTVGEPVMSSSTYYVYRQEDEELKEAVDDAVEQLRESGELSQISIDVIGGDYTESE
ncbi:MAG: transporter substrate-binding domain-containing protein [Lachnospiraceae bacterium]